MRQEGESVNEYVDRMIEEGKHSVLPAKRVKSVYTALEYDVIREVLDSYVVLNGDGLELQVLKEHFQEIPEVRTLSEAVGDEAAARHEVADVLLDWEAPEEGINPKDAVGALKPDLSLVPSALIIQVSEAMRNGAAKYGAYNWREKKVQVMTYLAAAQRHILQYLDGEDIAEDSGVHHLAHASACFGIVLDALATGNLVDNRPTAGAASRLIADLTKGGK